MATELKKNNRSAGSATGISNQPHLDLTTKDFPKRIISPEFLGMTRVTIGIQCRDCVGTSGEAKVNQGIDASTSLHVPFSPVVSIPLGENTIEHEFNVELGGTHVSVDLSGAVLGSQGKIIITFVGKRG